MDNIIPSLSRTYKLARGIHVWQWWSGLARDIPLVVDDDGKASAGRARRDAASTQQNSMYIHCHSRQTECLSLDTRPPCSKYPSFTRGRRKCLVRHHAGSSRSTDETTRSRANPSRTNHPSPSLPACLPTLAVAASVLLTIGHNGRAMCVAPAWREDVSHRGRQRAVPSMSSLSASLWHRCSWRVCIKGRAPLRRSPLSKRQQLP